MIDIAVKPFLPPGYFIRAASLPWEIRSAAHLRHKVFVEEQKIFQVDDRDDIDLMATHLVAVSTYAHEAETVVGTVRIHESEPGTWWGSRLAVDPAYRHIGKLGAELIRLAVSTANARGCNIFLANVQKQNVLLFRRLRWKVLKEIELKGVKHAHMHADLTYYPPIMNPVTGWYHKARSIAA